MARGGRRTPREPAAVSGPGALSQRTDGGPSQPVRSFPAEFQGQRGDLAALQQAAPLEAGGGGAPAASPPSATGAGDFTGLRGPTQLPDVPVGHGIDQPPRIIPRDPDAMLRAIYQMYPHPDIARLIQGG